MISINMRHIYFRKVTYTLISIIVIIINYNNTYLYVTLQKKKTNMESSAQYWPTVPYPTRFSK